MNSSLLTLLTFPLLPVLFCSAGILCAEELTPATLPQVQALIAPGEGEQDWLRIPWETDLETALSKAAREAKPVFLWEMDGHPLGCT